MHVVVDLQQSQAVYGAMKPEPAKSSSQTATLCCTWLTLGDSERESLRLRLRAAGQPAELSVPLLPGGMAAKPAKAWCGEQSRTSPVQAAGSQLAAAAAPGCFYHAHGHADHKLACSCQSENPSPRAGAQQGVLHSLKAVHRCRQVLRASSLGGGQTTAVQHIPSGRPQPSISPWPAASVLQRGHSQGFAQTPICWDSPRKQLVRMRTHVGKVRSTPLLRR